MLLCKSLLYRSGDWPSERARRLSRLDPRDCSSVCNCSAAARDENLLGAGKTLASVRIMAAGAAPSAGDWLGAGGSVGPISKPSLRLSEPAWAGKYLGGQQKSVCLERDAIYGKRAGQRPLTLGTCCDCRSETTAWPAASCLLQTWRRTRAQCQTRRLR